MSSYKDWLFFIPAILAVIFMLWVLIKFTQQLSGPDQSNPSPEAEPRYLRVVTAAKAEQTRGSAHGS